MFVAKSRFAQSLVCGSELILHESYGRRNIGQCRLCHRCHTNRIKTTTSMAADSVPFLCLQVAIAAATPAKQPTPKPPVVGTHLTAL